jgi:predicted DNA-binding transcriptional regulator YafY
MSDTTTRALSLLNLLQTHRHWPGAELAERLGVTERTVRRDVERLRDLGYRIESTPGVAGGYRLEAGSAVPPLLLNDEEAVAMAIGLRVAAAQRLVGGPETALTALAKLEQVLPAPLRRRVTALADAVQPAGIRSGEAVSTEVLGELALACRDHERVRFTYTSASGEVSRRRVEPYTLAPADRHWYLLCWDVEREDWRTFRVDRVAGIEHLRVIFEPRPLTPEQIEEFILVARSWVRTAVETDVVMELPIDVMREAFGQWGQGATAEDAQRTRWPVGGQDFRETMYGMAWIPAGVEYTTDLADAPRAELRETLERMLRALDAAPPPALRP